MNLRIPKRYRRGQRRSLLSLRWLWLWLLTPVVVYAGLHILQNREEYAPVVEQRLDQFVGDAERVLATALAPTPLPTEDPSIRLGIADAAWRRGAIGEAALIYAELAPSLPNSVELHQRLALARIMDNRPVEALEIAENAITADPFSADAWALRALAQDRNHDFTAALASARHALELAGDAQPQAAARAGAYLAEALFDLGYNERALSTVNSALQDDPDSPEALRVRAIITENAYFDYDAALADLQRARELAPHLAYVSIDLARLHNYRFSDPDTTIALLVDLIDLNPRNGAALFELGVIYLRVFGDHGRAIEYLSRCVESNPRSQLCHYWLGRAQIRGQQYPEASASFRKAIEIGPDVARHFWWAANADASQGNCTAAVPWLQRGYHLAQEDGDEVLTGEFEYLMSNCGLLTLPDAVADQG